MYNQNNNHHLNNQPISNGKITNHNHASQPTNGSPINIHQLFPTRTEKECLAELRKHARSYFAYQNMTQEWKNRFLGFMEGKKTLPLTHQEAVQPGHLSGTIIQSDQQYHRNKGDGSVYPVK